MKHVAWVYPWSPCPDYDPYPDCLDDLSNETFSISAGPDSGFYYACPGFCSDYDLFHCVVYPGLCSATSIALSTNDVDPFRATMTGYTGT